MVKFRIDPRTFPEKDKQGNLTGRDIPYEQIVMIINDAEFDIKATRKDDKRFLMHVVKGLIASGK